MALDIKLSCRQQEELNPVIQTMLSLALADVRSKGITPLVVETYRLAERQKWLYCKGRTVAQCVANGINKDFAETWIAYFKKNKIGGPVTWTLNSIHLQRKAIDVIPQRVVNGKLTAIWEHSWKDKDVKTLVETMEKYGFEAGDRWAKTPDSPHYQVKATIGTVVRSTATTKALTLAIQKGLNVFIDRGVLSIKVKLKEDGDWGNKTDLAIIAFRKYCKWSEVPYLGAYALGKVLEVLR